MSHDRELHGLQGSCPTNGVCYQLLPHCLRLGLQALLVLLSRREGLTPIGAVEGLGAFDLADEPHV